MAVIKSGAISSLAKSIGGVNFYRAEGLQYARAKPVLPADYQPSLSQQAVRDLFGQCSTIIDKISGLRQHIERNYRLINKNRTVTPREMAIRYMVRFCMRDSAGIPYSTAIRNAFVNYLKEEPYGIPGWAIPLSFQNGIPIPIGFTQNITQSNVQMTLTQEGWGYWQNQLLSIGYHVEVGSAPTMLVGAGPDTTLNVGPWQAVAMALSSNRYTAQQTLSGVNVGTLEIAAGQAALAAKLDPAYIDGLENQYICLAPITYYLSANS